MNANHMYIMPHDLAAIHHELGYDIARALEVLSNKLNNMPIGDRGASAREFAQMREAKALLCSLKYPDSLQSVRLDELAWALKSIRESHATNLAFTGLFDRVAQMLGIDLNDLHAIPLDLNRRIGNELEIMNRYKPAPSELSLKEAV